MNTGTTYKLFKQTKIFFAALFVFLMVGVGSVGGATKTWDGSSSVYWNTAANWTPSGVPTSSDDVIIPNNFNVTVNTAAVCASFTINSGNQTNAITISGTNSLSVTNAITINAGTGSGDNKYISVGSGTLTAGSVTMTDTGNDNRDSYISVSTGTINVSGNITMNGVAARNQIVFTDAGTLNVGETGTITGGTISNATGGYTALTRGTVNYNGSTQTVGAYTYYNLTTTNTGVKSLSANTSILSNLTINTNSTLDLDTYTANRSAAGGTLTVAGTMQLGANTGGQTGSNFPTNFNTRTMTGGTVEYDMNGNQTVYGITYNNLTLSGTNAKTLQTGTTSIGGNLTLSGTASTTTVVGTTIGGNLNIGDGTTFTTGAYNLTVTGTTTIGGGSSGNLTISSYNGTKIFTGLVTINAGGTWNNSVGSPVTFRGGITNNGTFTPGSTYTYTFDTNAQSLNGSLNMSGSTIVITGINLTNYGTLTLGSALNGTGALINSSSGTLNIEGSGYINITTLTNQGTFTLTSSGSFGTSAANFTNTGTINLNGSGYITGMTNNAGGTVNFINASQTIGTFTNATSTSVLNISALISSTSAINTLTATATGNTVNYNGSGDQTVKNTTYSNLTVSGSGTKTLSGGTTTTVTGILTLTNGILSTNANNLLSVTNTATTAITGGSSTSFINGPVKWTLPASLATGSTYNFPVGNGTTYLPFALVNPTTGTGTVTAQVEAFASDPGGSVDATLDSKSATEYWSLVTSGNFTNSYVSLTRQTTIAPLDVIAGSTAKAGAYTNLGGTPGAYGVSSSNAIGTNRFFVLAKEKPTIPTITTSISSLTGFTYPMGSGPSGQQSFTVGGTYLTTNITVLPTDSFEISLTSGASFAPQSVITLSVINGTVATSTVYVRMKAGFAVGTVKSVLNPITCASTGATTKTISCTGTVTTAPVITATPTTLTGFSYTFTAGPSAQQSFTVSGTNLIGNITVTPPTDYEISTTSGSGFASTALSVASGTVIYVRLKSGLGVGSWVENIVLTSTSANQVNVACSGTIGPAPTILNAISALSAFIYTSGAGPSGEQTFTVSGSNLTANLVITPPTNFQISTTSGSGFQSTAITLTQSGGTVNTTTIYVRMKAGLAVGSYGPENITLTSTGASGKAVSCKGSVVSSAAILTSKLALNGFGYKQYSAGDTGTGVANGGPSSEQSFIVAGTSLGSNAVTITAPANYEISQTSGGAFQTSITLTPSSGKVNNTIYVRLISLKAAGDYTGNITVASSGLTTINVACVGKVFATPLITASSDGGTYCPGSTINLTSTGGDIQSRYWEGPNNFYSVSQNPQLTTNATTALSGTYTVTGNVVVGGNLVTNGDFEAGNSSFGSSYGYAGTASDALQPEGLYTVVSSPQSVHSNFTTHGDHTSGTGLQMVLNGSPTAGVVIWNQSVPVVPGANYQFTYWVQTVNITTPINPSRLQLYVNGVAAGPIYTASSTYGQWTQFLYNASAGSSTVLNLELINQNTVANGNDFALDDIVFQQILSATASTNISVTPTVPVSVSVAASANPVTQGATVIYTATPTNGGTTPAYAWYVNGNPVSGATSSTYSYVPSNGDVVKCVLTSSISCATNNPATSNTVTMTVNPAVNYWRGTNGTDWGTASNWTAGYIPSPGDNVVYCSTSNSWGSDAINDLVLDIDRTIGSLINATSKRLVIPAGKSLIVNNTITTNGNPGLIYIHSSETIAHGSLIYHNSESSPVYATVEMYTKSGWDLSKPVNQKYSWQYFGIPVSRFKASPTFDGGIVRQMFESGNDTTTHWQSLTNDSYLEPFRGYELCYESPRIITFSGALVNANFNSGQLVKTITGGALYPGQHLFANSYTAAIDIRQIQFGSEMDSTVYMYNTGTFTQWQALKSTRIGNTPGQYTSAPQNLAGYSQVPRQVPSMNSMLVRIKAGISVPTANSYISINYNSVAMGNTDLQRAPAIEGNESPACTIIDVEGELSSDRMWVFTMESCKRTFDNGDDGVKMGGTALSPQIYGIEPDGNYQIDAVDDINNTNLAFQAGQDTEYTLTFTHENIAGRYSKIYLLDLAERTVVDITETGSTYSFTAQSTPKAVNRFRIITSPEETGNEAPSKIKIFNSYNLVYVLNNSQQPGDMYIYDISGRSFGHQKVAANSISTIPITLQNAYIVKFVSPEETKIEKIIIR